MTDYPDVSPLYSPLRRRATPMVALHRSYNEHVLRNTRRSDRWRLAVRRMAWPMKASLKIWRRTRRHAAFVREKTGKGTLRQLRDQADLVFGLGLPPDAYMKFQLFDEPRRAVAPEYLHRYETKQYLFRLLNRDADKELVNDKLRFHDFCRERGLSTARVIGAFPDGRGDRVDLPAADVLSKPRRGKGGRAVKRWRFDGDAYVDPEDGERRTANELVDHLRAGEDGVDRESILLQVAESNHDAIADLGRGVLSTARIMSCRRLDGEVEACCAVFRVPGESASVDNFHAGGIASAVDMETGRLSSAISIRLRSPRFSHLPGRDDVPIEGRELPGFRDAVDLVERAHRRLDGFVVIGWDVGLTGSGPCLVEANGSPCVDTIQRPLGRPIGQTRLGELLLDQWRAATREGHA